MNYWTLSTYPTSNSNPSPEKQNPRKDFNFTGILFYLSKLYSGLKHKLSSDNFRHRTNQKADND